MKKLNSIGEKLSAEMKNKFSIEKIVKRNKLQSIFNKIIIIAVTIFVLFTIITYETLKYSNSNQNEVYEDGYLASSYANKINEDILAQHPNVFLTAQAVKKWLLHSNRILPL